MPLPLIAKVLIVVIIVLAAVIIGLVVTIMSADSPGQGIDDLKEIYDLAKKLKEGIDSGEIDCATIVANLALLEESVERSLVLGHFGNEGQKFMMDNSMLQIKQQISSLCD